MKFPTVQPKLQRNGDELPVYREVAWDYKSNTPIWQNGSPVIVEGREAVAVWAYNALQTPRRRHIIYSWEYANELENLIGSGYTEVIQQAEALRLVRECLMVSPYIQEVRDVKASFADGCMFITAKLITVYGEVSVDVRPRYNATEH